MIKQLKALIEDLELNHEYCPKDVILAAAAELRRLHAENEAFQYELKAEQALSFRSQVAELEAEVEALRADAGLMRGGIGGYEQDMTREDIIRMAREAGFYFYETMYVWTTPTENMPYPEGVYTENLERFAALVAAAERKECAKVADEWATNEQRQFGNGGPAAVIRARSRI